MSLYDDKTSDDLWYYKFINKQKNTLVAFQPL